MNTRPISLALLITLVSVCVLARQVTAQEADEFRVETDVFVGDQKMPVSETLTLFSGDVIYDFLISEPEEITILDVRHSRVVLLDTARRVKTTLTTQDLLQLTAALKADAVRVDKQQKELFFPRFEQQFDEVRQELVLSGKTLTYRVEGIEPRFSAAAKRYRQFADWYARLNAVRPGNLPPFARIELNRALAEKGLLPRRVSRTVVTRQTLVDKKNVAESRHSFIWNLSNSDRKRIENAGRYQASFKQVSRSEYWGIEQADAGD